MSINLHSASTHDGLFDLQSLALVAIRDITTQAGTSIPGDVQLVLNRFDAASGFPLSFEATTQPLTGAVNGWQTSSQSLCTSLATYCQAVLAGYVDLDSAAPQSTLAAQLAYLVADMQAQGAYVAANTVGATLTAGTNVGDTVITWALTDGKGASLQNVYAETLTLLIGANPSTTQPAISCLGAPSVALLNPAWPQGSGRSITITAADPANSLVANGTFEAATQTNIPDGWLVVVGAPGTTVLLTAPEQQTVAIAGTPTGGTYLLYYTDRNSTTWSTEVLPYNATAAQVQAALAALPGLSGVTVTATGTTPNYTHTVVFTGVGGNVAELTSQNLLTGGSPTITHATTVGGDANDYRGVSLKLVGNSSTLHALYAPLTRLTNNTVYFCHLRLRRSGTATGATIKVAVVQQIGGTALDDTGGTANELEIDAAALSDSAYTSQWFSFRLPATAVAPSYLRIAATVAIPTGATIYIDEVAVVAGQAAYPGGPYLAAFSGRDPAVAGDSWTLAVTNNRAGLWQTYYGRVFNMANYGLILPTSGAGDQIPEALVTGSGS